MASASPGEGPANGRQVGRSAGPVNYPGAMADLPDKLVSRPPQQRGGSGPSPRPPWSGGFGEIRFLPARWILVLVAMARLLLKGGKLGKFGVAGLVWSFAPRKLKFAAAGLAAAATIVLIGAVAAIALLALQLN
jgi:hypothetical protein